MSPKEEDVSIKLNQKTKILGQKIPSIGRWTEKEHKLFMKGK